MKALKFLGFVLLALLLVSGCDGSINSDNPAGSDDGSVEKNLSFVQKDIDTISPYSYGSIGISSTSAVSGGSYSRATLNPDETYLSYIGPGEVGFQPLTFENSSGAKFIFRNVTVSEIGGGFYLCYMRELQKVSKEPRVIYEEVGADEGTGEIIYEPREIIVDVTYNYGENEAIIDISTGNVYLTRDPEVYNDGVFIEYLDDFENYRIETPNALFLSGFTYESGGNERNMFMLRKDALDAGTLFPMLNTTVLDLSEPLAASDDLAMFRARDKGTDNYYTLIRKTGSYFDPVRLEFEPCKINFVDSYGQSRTETFSPSEYDNTIVLHRDRIHVVMSYDENIFVMTYTVSDDGLKQEGYQRFDGGIKNSGYATVRLLDYANIGNDVNAYYIIDNGNQTKLLKISYHDNSTEATVLDADEESVSNTTFSAVGDRIYWMKGGAYSANAAICYADFSTQRVVSISLQGKSTASSKINVCEDGIVMFWQNLGGSVGVFSMNVNDPNPTPELVMRNEVDVEEIINIDSL